MDFIKHLVEACLGVGCLLYLFVDFSSLHAPGIHIRWVVGGCPLTVCSLQRSFWPLDWLCLLNVFFNFVINNSNSWFYHLFYLLLYNDLLSLSLRNINRDDRLLLMLDIIFHLFRVYDLCQLNLLELVVSLTILLIVLFFILRKFIFVILLPLWYADNWLFHFLWWSALDLLKYDHLAWWKWVSWLFGLLVVHGSNKELLGFKDLVGFC